ncbi:hypothetical protein PHMEG_00035075 [Phytophthora megakarya]|uniref:Uncharacterized protein n=1 Tax=Phytophthora megakarya TaxID=4795 RepID=A0A225UPR3_9STRA|nr:hypothetical protein PHMEG_00035075 [Phytophthora megakarya]
MDLEVLVLMVEGEVSSSMCFVMSGFHFSRCEWRSGEDSVATVKSPSPMCMPHHSDFTGHQIVTRPTSTDVSV